MLQIGRWPVVAIKLRFRKLDLIFMRLDILFKWLRHSAVSAYLQLQKHTTPSDTDDCGGAGLLAKIEDRS
jgi:hypothetical protein